MATLIIPPKSSVAPDQDAVHAEVFIAAPRERVYAALTDPRQSVKWWGQKDRYICTEFNMDVRVGGKWSSRGTSVKMGDFEVGGEYLELDPPGRLSYTWATTWMPQSTKVVWELEEQGNGTLVKITHTGFAGNIQQANGHSEGWMLVMGWLRSFAENGETVDDRG